MLLLLEDHDLDHLKSLARAILPDLQHLPPPPPPPKKGGLIF
jgi:hypothetical protein